MYKLIRALPKLSQRLRAVGALQKQHFQISYKEKKLSITGPAIISFIYIALLKTELTKCFDSQAKAGNSGRQY